MEIVFVSPEMTPYAHTGGLADVLEALPFSIAKLGHSVSVFIPNYKMVSEQKLSFDTIIDPLNIPVGSDVETGRLLGLRQGDVSVFAIDQPDLFNRDGLYGTPLGDYPDNDLRFVFFQRAVLESMKKIKLTPDIIHCHDWQTGLIPAYIKTLYRSDPFFKDTKTIFTVHNLSYQGNFPPDSISTTGLSWEEFRFDRLEFYGKISFLKAGLAYSDVLTTVSKRYAQEIQTKEFGCGMEGLLSYRKKDLFGVLNGIDAKEWDPVCDPSLARNFDAKSVDKKTACKAALQKENHLAEDPHAPLFGFVGRLDKQKGIDILEPLLEEMVAEGWQFVLLGAGEENYQERFRQAAKKYPKSIAANISFDARAAKRIFAGVDIFLMMSQFEPCGLAQLYALRYGAVPLVREVGGFVDTVENYDLTTGKGNGFVFPEYNQEALFKTMRRAVSVFKDKKKWFDLIKNCMSLDFSWAKSAREYNEIYVRAEKKALGV